MPAQSFALCNPPGLPSAFDLPCHVMASPHDSMISSCTTLTGMMSNTITIFRMMEHTYLLERSRHGILLDSVLSISTLIRVTVLPPVPCECAFGCRTRLGVAGRVPTLFDLIIDCSCSDCLACLHKASHCATLLGCPQLSTLLVT